MRNDHKLALKKIKQQINAFCIRHGFCYDGTKWTLSHLKWLKKLEITNGLGKSQSRQSIMIKPKDFKSETVSSTISDKNFFISSAISELRTCLVLAVINCANRNTSFLCFLIFLLSTCSPFNLRSFKSSHAFALNGIRQVGLNTGIPSTIIFQ